MPYVQLLLNLNFGAILLHVLNFTVITVFQFYCPWEARIWLLCSFLLNLALQRLTGSGGENLISNMLSTVCLREAWKSWHNLIREGFSSKYVSYVIEHIQQFGVVSVVCLGREL